MLFIGKPKGRSRMISTCFLIANATNAYTFTFAACCKNNVPRKWPRDPKTHTYKYAGCLYFGAHIPFPINRYSFLRFNELANNQQGQRKHGLCLAMRRHSNWHAPSYLYCAVAVVVRGQHCCYCPHKWGPCGYWKSHHPRGRKVCVDHGKLLGIRQ